MSCDNMKPYACGGSMNPNTVQNPCDRSLHFEGADDVTINQGVGIDLTEGVHAYDAHGNEIEYTVEPESIEKCEVGDHVITYTATGEGSRSVPTMCGETALYARACNIITEIKKRIITILQSANPIIRGLSDALIQPDETFSPLSGVTSEDANGNELTVSYSGRYTNTAEGDIATFDTPYAEPMVSLVADIDPIQDLHGYDRPWVGGGGKNLLIPVLNNNASSLSANGCTLTVQDQKFKIVGTATGSGGRTIMRSVLFNLKAGTYEMSSTSTTAPMYIHNSGGTLISGRGAVANSPVSFTLDSDTDVFIGFNISTGRTYDEVIQAQIEKGSTATAYEPYSNICPISGWDSVDVSVCGKNLWDEEWEVGGINTSGQETTTSGYYRSKNYIAVLPNTTYYFKVPTTMSVMFYDSNKDFIEWTTANNATVTTPSNCRYLRFRNTTANTWTPYDNDISINYPSTDTEYHAHEGQTYHTTLPQTVYGGTLDVVSGVLTVDRAMVTLNGQTTGIRFTEVSQTTTADGQKYVAYISMASHNIKNNNIAICDAYAFMDKTPQNMHMGEFDGRGSYFRFVIADQNLNTLALWNAHLAENPITLVYELATPQTIQLTPTQIDSLLGRNNVWADSGDVTVWYVDEIPQSAFSYPVRGKYTITYTAEDECGNRTEKDRTIQVGEETFRTVIYEDKTLIINERSSDIEENERLHGRAEYVYDAMDNDHPYVFSSPEDVPWNYVAGYPERVEFGSEVHPTSTAYWFYYMNQVNTFDFTNLDTSNVTDMKYMFYGCEHILNLAPELDTSNVTDMSHMFERCIATPEIDVSSFDTSNVTDMSSMFASCYNLRAIYAKPMFITDNVISSNLMFGYDVHLVGGMGTPYDSNYEDKTYARIDNPPDEPGYFTSK